MRHTHFLACRVQADTALPVEPVGARHHTLTTPAFAFIELAYQTQQTVGGGMDVGGKLGDFPR
jgi:hypothetical protein